MVCRNEAPMLASHTDLFCTNEASNLFYRNLGDGTFEECAARLNLTDANERGVAAAALDTDGDGRARARIAMRYATL